VVYPHEKKKKFFPTDKKKNTKGKQRANEKKRNTNKKGCPGISQT
jgi:hypothetical protein